MPRESTISGAGIPMISQKTLDALKSIGLNLYERKLYAALLARGTSTAGELSEIANVPRSRSYDVLESLADKGFVVVQHSKPLRYVAIPPDQALDRAKNRIREKLETMVIRLEQFKDSDALGELKQLYSKGVSLVEAADLSGSLKGRYALHQHIEMMLKAAKKTIDIITTEDGLKELANAHQNLIEAASARGVQIRIVAPVTSSTKEIAKTLNGVAKIKNLTSKTKVPVARMALVDGAQVVMALTDDKKTHHSQDVAFWTSSDHFADSFAAPTFEMIWKQLQ